MTHQDKITRLREMKYRSGLGGGEDRIKQQHKKGKLTAWSGSSCCWIRAALSSLTAL